MSKLRFPWRVSFTQRDRYPTVVDATGAVVAQLTNGSVADANRIVANCNLYAETHVGEDGRS